MKIYLGDGAYAEYEPGTNHVTLTTESGHQVMNTIYLEPEVADRLVEFVKKMHEEQGF